MAKNPRCLQLPTTRYLETLPSPEPSPEELTYEHLDVDQLAAQEGIDRDCRYAQKLNRRRKRLFQWAMGRIPDREREAVRLSLEGKSQKEIGEIQGVSQVAALYRLRLAQNRLQWLCNVGAKVSAKRLKTATNKLLRAEDQRILLAWWETGSQSEAARRIFGDSSRQRACRDSIVRSKTIIGQIPGLWRISQAVESLFNNGYLMQDMAAYKRPESQLTGLSRRERLERNCCAGETLVQMTRCAEAE